MARSLLVLLATTAAACGGGGSTRAPAEPAQPVAAPAAKAEGTPCDRAIAHLFEITTGSDTPAIREVSRRVVLRHCTADAWSAAVTDCLVAMKVPADGDACETQLTPEQRDALAADLMKELSAAGVQPEIKSGSTP